MGGQEHVEDRFGVCKASGGLSPCHHARKAAGEDAQHRAGIQYWTPPGHNSWVGDVATFFYQGRYHVFYLYDRRHHQSKFGKGAHYFEHLSTTDFKTWTEHEAATPLEEQWECIGTGMPFVFNNRLCHQLRPAHRARLSGGPDNVARAVGIPEHARMHGLIQMRHNAGYPCGRDLFRQ